MDELKVAIDGLVKYARSASALAELAEPIDPARWAELERAGVPPFPAEYRALLELHDGLAIDGVRVLGSRDWLEPTTLYQRAREFLDDSARFDERVAACLPIANLGQPNDWLLHDPVGELRDGGPGFFVRLTADDLAVDDLAAALHRELRLRSP